MPKRAALGATNTGGSATDFRETVNNADIVYFPSERAASAGRSEPAALLLEALEQSGAPFAIAWDSIDATQQPLLDQLRTQPTAEREQTAAHIPLAGTGRARAHCRSVLSDPQLVSIQQIALRPPASTDGGGGDPPLTIRFRSPADGMETFAEHMTAAESLSATNVAAAYHARLIEQQFAAEQIVRHFEAGATGKLLVFMSAADLEAGQGVPFYVAQKLQLRQLVFGAPTERNARSLLTRRLQERGGAVVDSTPARGPN